MPSPFPGMNPWLEQDDFWPDFHTSFLVALKEQLSPRLDDEYYVVLERYIYIHEPEGRTQRARADLLVTHSGSEAGVQRTPALALLEAPAEVELLVEATEEMPYLAVRRGSLGQPITVLELLSPSNKGEPDRTQYLNRRKRILASPTHLVEIDLLRGGQPMPDADRPHCDYSVMVSRSEKRPHAGFWPIGLRDRLPEIPIPLRNPDPDVRLDLQAALHHVYDISRYSRFLYQNDPSPAFRPEDDAWARSFLPTKEK